jgi:hypothetical protein
MTPTRHLVGGVLENAAFCRSPAAIGRRPVKTNLGLE